MAFVKLDCRMLYSTIWLDKDARDLFITALLMAVPRELKKSEPQVEVNSTNDTDFIVPAGWYGFVDSSGPGIINMAGMEMDRGKAALVRLGSPEGDTKSTPFEGRRLVRINGGYIVLNYDHYRRKDHTTAERSARYRAKKQSDKAIKPKKLSPSRVTPRGVTQAEAYKEQSKNKNSLIHNHDMTKPHNEFEGM